MPELNLLTDLVEMIAAIAAFGITFVLYLETRYMRNEMRKIRAELRQKVDDESDD
jgi:hypothetical protein